MCTYQKKKCNCGFYSKFTEGEIGHTIKENGDNQKKIGALSDFEWGTSPNGQRKLDGDEKGNQQENYTIRMDNEQSKGALMKQGRA